MNKLKKVFDSFDIHTVVRLVCIVFCLLILFSSCLTASAATYLQFPVSIGVFNLMNIPFEQISVIGVSNGQEVIHEELGVYEFNAPLGIYSVSYDNDGSLLLTEYGSATSFRFTNHSGIPEGQYYMSSAINLYSDSGAIIKPIGSYTGIGYGEFIELDMSISLYYNTGTTFYIDENPSSLTLTNNITFILSPIDSNGSPTDCPSLQTQINQFNGTYSDFEGMLLGSTNEVIYQGYRNKLQEMFRQGQDSVTLEQLLADYDGSFQQLITLLSENNLRLLDEYADYIEDQRSQSFNDGYAQGTEDGFNDGYNRGYNKGSSEVFGDTLLGEAFNMPLNALNNWVLFETPTGLEVTMGGLATGLLALSILIILIKMFAGG